MMAGYEIGALLMAGAILLAMVLALATGVRRLQRISGWILAPAGICGLCFYTLAYMGEAADLPGMLAAAAHGVYTTCLMFMGRNDYSSMTRMAPWFVENIWLQTLFWTAHLSALFVSASAVLSTLGKKMLQTLRLQLVRRKDLYLVYGLHEQSLYFGRDISRQKKGLVVYVAPRPKPEQLEQALAFGGIVRQEPYLYGGRVNRRLMRLAGLNRGLRRQVYVLALDESETVNIELTRAMLEHCRAKELAPERVRVFLRSHGELDYSQLAEFEKNSENIYDVDAFSDAELSARLLVNESPPYCSMTFDENGVAKEDFCALVIGFGQVGQHTLRQVVMNGQFNGSRFSAVVVDKDAQRISGQYARRYVGMLSEYDIRFNSMDIRSHDFYDLLDGLAARLKYVVVCLGDDDANYEATADLERYFTRMDEADRPSILVSVCNKRYVATTQKNIRFFDRQQQVFSSRILLREDLDERAVAVNWSYNEYMKKASDAITAWRTTGYFSRESCRASADFIPAMLCMAGFDPEALPTQQAFEARVVKGGALLESLAISEHLRWNAFHYAMGYTTMPLKEVQRRAAEGRSPVQKDTTHLRHSCLVPWNKLDRVSEVVDEANMALEAMKAAEAAAKGMKLPESEPEDGEKEREPLDYKELDRINVYRIPRTLQLAQALEAE